MDAIQQVDCFEKLHRYLIGIEPDLQARIDATQPHACRSENRPFLATHMVAVAVGLDPRTAEARRRIRRLVQGLRNNNTVPSSREEKAVREDNASVAEWTTERRGAQLRRALDSLEALSPDPDHAGAALDERLRALENTPARTEWIRKTFPCLTGLNVYRFLHAIGYPVIVPDRRCRTFFFRLGLLSDSGGGKPQQLAACRVAEDLSRNLHRSPLEVNAWIQAFTGGFPGAAPEAALCRTVPLCDRCDLQNYCQYFRFQRPGQTDGPLPVKQWRPSERPRERLARLGSRELDDVELLAIVLRTGSGKVNVLELARRLLERFGDLQGIEEASLEELQEVHGIGQMKAVDLKAAFELGRRQTTGRLVPGDVLDCSEKVFEIYRGRFLHVMQEEFVLVMLNNKGRVIREEVISRGGLDSSVVHPREVFKAAIRASAAAVIFIHNHPSGDPTPSHDDFAVTRRLQEASELLKIRVLDHVVIGADSYYSFTDGEVVQVPSEKEGGASRRP